MRPAAFYQIRLPFVYYSNITSPWGRTSTGCTGRYLFSPDLGWHYCSPERLLTFELLDLQYEVAGWVDMCDDEAEWWHEQADELLHDYRCGMGEDMTYISSRDVCGPQPDDLSQLRPLVGKFAAAVPSSDVDILDDNGEERFDADIWDEAREYACGNHRV